MPSNVGWGILGAGRIAARFAEGLRAAPGSELVAVGSRTPAKAEELARQVGARCATVTYEALVAHPRVDVVYVATPNALHREHCLLALDAGKPVLCEKPFATSAAEAAEVAARARSRGLFCMEAMWMRFAPAARRLQALVGQGAVGTPRLVTASLGFRFEVDRANPVFAPELGGGALLDLGVYPLSLAVWLLGRPRSAVAVARSGRTGVDEQVSAILDFDSGGQAVISASLTRQLSNDAVVVGTEGLVRLREPLYCPEALELTRSRPIGRASVPVGLLGRVARQAWLGGARRWVGRLRHRTIRAAVRGNGMGHEAEEVVRCLRSAERESPFMPLDDSIAVLEAVDTIRGAWTVTGEAGVG